MIRKFRTFQLGIHGQTLLIEWIASEVTCMNGRDIQTQVVHPTRNPLALIGWDRWTG